MMWFLDGALDRINHALMYMGYVSFHYNMQIDNKK